MSTPPKKEVDFRIHLFLFAHHFPSVLPFRYFYDAFCITRKWFLVVIMPKYGGFFDDTSDGRKYANLLHFPNALNINTFRIKGQKNNLFMC